MTETSNETRIDHQEWLILQVSLHIEKLMEDKKVNRAELARRLGVNRAYITQLLDGANLSLRKVADVLMALDASLMVNAQPLGFHTTLAPDTEVSPPCSISQWGIAVAKEKRETFVNDQASITCQGSAGVLCEPEKDLLQVA
ncbi:helix-turn-helix domain-containing protein [Planctomycetota bacterium]